MYISLLNEEYRELYCLVVGVIYQKSVRLFWIKYTNYPPFIERSLIEREISLAFSEEFGQTLSTFNNSTVPLTPLLFLLSFRAERIDKGFMLYNERIYYA